MRLRRLTLLLPFAVACSSVDTTSPRFAHAPADGAARDVDPASAAYTITDIGNGLTGAYRVNASDLVLASGPVGERAWTATQGVLDITAPDGFPLQTDAVNDRGEIAGYTIDDAGVMQHAWFRSATGTFQEIKLPANQWFYLQVLNDSGDVAGGYMRSDNTTAAFVWSRRNGVRVIHETAPNDVIAEFGITDDDAVAGMVQHLADGTTSAFTWTPSAGYTVDENGSSYAAFADMNNAGTRVLRVRYGATRRNFLVYADGRRVELPDPSGSGRVLATGINNDGYVTGTAFDPARNTAVAIVWAPDLTVTELAGLSQRNASGNDLNSLGDVAGSATDANGHAHAVLWMHVATYAELERMVASYVDNAGIARSLAAKLSAADAASRRGDPNAKSGAIGAFVHEVRAQTGKAITAARAETLIALAGRL